jgi:ribosomal protein S18 acetylase RimI-like enzyme
MAEENAAIQIVRADYGNSKHAAAIVLLLDEYACDPMGGAAPLSDDVKMRLVPALAACSSAHSFIAFSGGEAAGLLNGFETLSTFRALPLFNIHDVIVAQQWRRCGIAQQLFAAAELFARGRGCCKLTLEVLQGNTGARDLYRRLGFNDYSLLPEMGNALFLQKLF